VGAGISYEIRWHDDKGWTLSSFDEYRSWERKHIELQSPQLSN
jgi:hypothetical protein